MIFSWREYGVFLAALLAAGWLIYPSEYTRGLMYRQEGDRSRSIAFFTGYLARHPRHKGASRALAAAYEASGRPELAAGPLLELYRGRRGDLDAGGDALALLARAGLEAEARAFRWELVADLRALPRPPRRALEELLYRAFQDAASRQDDAETLRALTALAEVSGEDGGYRSAMLRLLLERRQLEAALVLLEESSRRSPGNAELRRMIARLHRLRGDEAAALRAIAAALLDFPGHAGLLGDRVALHIGARRWAQAETELRRLIALQPREEAWLRELARCLAESGRLGEAVQVYEQLISRRPEDRERWWAAVYAYSDRGEHAAAAERLEAMTHRFPDDAKIFNMLVYELQAAGGTERAISALRRRVASFPQEDKSRRALASLLMSEERHAEAVEHYRALVERRPDEPDLWLALAYAQQTAGDRPAAARSLESYLARFPTDGATLEKLAVLYNSMGRRARAIELLRLYFRPGPAAAR